MSIGSVLPAVAALLAILAAVVLGGRLLRFTGYAREQRKGRLAVVETLNIDPRRRLLLLECDGRCVLLLAGQTDVVLGWLPAAPP